MLTVDQAIQLGIRHALRGASPAAELEELQILRFAWSHLVGMHQWSWLRNRTATATIVKDQPWVELPADLLSIDTLERDALVCARLLPCSMADIVRARASDITIVADTFMWAPEWVEDDLTREPMMRLAIYPSQIETIPNGLLLTYTAGRFTVKNGPTDTAYIPLPSDASCDQLYIDIVRSITKGYELDDTISKEASLYEISRGPTFQSAVLTDLNRRRRMGPISNGWLAQDGDRRSRRLRIPDPIDVSNL